MFFWGLKGHHSIHYISLRDLMFLSQLELLTEIFQSGESMVSFLLLDKNILEDLTHKILQIKQSMNSEPCPLSLHAGFATSWLLWDTGKNHCASLCLSFLVCKIRMIILTTSGED